MGLTYQNKPAQEPALTALGRPSSIENETSKILAPYELTYAQLIDYELIWEAYFACIKGKRYRPRYYDFELNAESYLLELFQELLFDRYQPRQPNIFSIFCKCGQKRREIHASAIRDSVVQRLLYNHLYPIFNRSFIFDNYGCRKGKGTLKAADRCQEFIRKSPKDTYYLQLDIRKFYYNLDHEVLYRELAKKITDPKVLGLCMLFVCNVPNENSYTPFASNVGLDVGAMLSQLFGLIYLNRLDHYAKRTLGIKRYIRYVDDIVIIGETKEQCLEYSRKLEAYINNELKLKLRANFIQPLHKGINFAGFRTWREYRLVRKFCIRNFNRKLHKEHPNPKSIQAMLAHARPSASYAYMCNRVLDTHPELVNDLRGCVQHDLLKLQASQARQTRRG